MNFWKARQNSVGHRQLHGVNILVNERVAVDDLTNFIDRFIVRHQLVFGGHVNAINIWITHWGRSTGHVNLAGTGLARHLNNFTTGGAAHNGIVDQQNITALELAGNHVQFLSHRLLAHCLAWHDEGSTDITIFDKPFAVRQS